MFNAFFSRGFSAAISKLMVWSFIAVLPFMGGCGEDDNPILDDHDHDHEEETIIHADADGFALEVDGTEVYRQFQGNESGGLTVGVGAEVEVHVLFLDDTGAETHFGEEEEGDDHDHDETVPWTLGLTDYDSSIIDIHLHEEEHEEEEHEEEEHDDHDDHDEEGWAFEVVGVKAGTTGIKLQLLHGDHADFTAALLIPVTVQ